MKSAGCDGIYQMWRVGGYLQITMLLLHCSPVVLKGYCTSTLHDLAVYVFFDT
jgi:hypothetical protein